MVTPEAGNTNGTGIVALVRRQLVSNKDRVCKAASPHSKRAAPGRMLLSFTLRQETSSGSVQDKICVR